MKVWSVAILGCALSVTSLVARAEDGPWRVDVEGGGLLPHSHVVLPTRELHILPGTAVSPYPGESVNVVFEPGGSYALGIGYRIHDYVEVGAQAARGFAQGASGVVRFAGTPYGTRLVAVRSQFEVYSVTAGVRLYIPFPVERLRPWTLAQMGWYKADGRTEEPVFCPEHGIECGQFFEHGSDDGLGFNVGTGFDVRVTRRLAAGVDVRYHDAPHVLGGFDYFTTMLDLSLQF